MSVSVDEFKRRQEKGKKLFRRIQKLNKTNQGYVMCYIFGYMESSMDNKAFKSFDIKVSRYEESER